MRMTLRLLVLVLLLPIECGAEWECRTLVETKFVGDKPMIELPTPQPLTFVIPVAKPAFQLPPGSTYNKTPPPGQLFPMPPGIGQVK